MSQHVAPGLCRFIFSADLPTLVRCRIDRLLPQSLAEEIIGDEPLDVEVDLVLDGEIYSTAQSSQAVFDESPKEGLFRPQHFVFAVKLRDLPRLSSLVVRLKSQGSPVRTFRAVLPLFNCRAVLRQGRQLLALQELSDGGDAEAVDWLTHSNEAQLRTTPDGLEEALRLAQAADLQARGWLPASAPGFEGSEESFARNAQETLEASGLPWLSLHLPTFLHPVVFAEPQYSQDAEVPSAVVAAPRREDIDAKSVAALAGPSWLLQPLVPPEERGSAGLRSFKCFVDYDATKEHPAVHKEIRLSRSSLNRVKDRDARPNADELRRLNELIRRPRRQFSAEEKHLLFRFRWSLTDQPGALTKFLHAVDWSDLEERQHAIELLGHWSPVDIDDALELLSKDFRGVREVRRHAVARLRSASDQDLLLYLLQLVQALRYEPILEEAAGEGAAQEEEEPPLLVASQTASEFSPPARKHVGGGPSSASLIGGETPSGRPGEGQQRCALMWFLIRRAVRCRTLATLFYWYVVAETDDRERGALFHRVRERFLEALAESPEGQGTKQMLERQVALRRKLLWCVQCAKAMKRDRMEKKVERFRQALGMEPPEDGRPACRLSLVDGLDETVPLPVDPSVSLSKVLAEQSFLLKSAMNPAVLTCQVQKTSDGPRAKKTQKKIMVKEGDDLRQDQLVLQLVILMDSILKKYGLDMQLTTYQVIALSTSDGMVEFVPDATNLSAALKDHNYDLQQFFRAHRPLPLEPGEQPGPNNSYGIRPEVLENFIRSSAGYCVITYILGIGDRHLDNLMVTPDGRLFHIDFGFILGKDPKPFPPPMRICKEMVEGMGGHSSAGYQSFKSKCCQAFKILRRHAKLIINLLYLMTDSGIRDLCGDPQFAILKVEQKFQAVMDDEQAEEHFLKLIDESVNSLFPVVLEKMHRLSIAMQ